DRDDPAAEEADAGREPQRRVAARAAELEHLAAGMVDDETEQEAAGRRRDLTRAQPGGEPLLSLAPVLLLEPSHHRPDARVEHQSTVTLTTPSTARADGDALVGIPVALAQRAVVVRAAVLDRVVLACDVVHADGERTGAHDLHPPRRQLVGRAHVELGHASSGARAPRNRRAPRAAACPSPCAARP